LFSIYFILALIEHFHLLHPIIPIYTDSYYQSVCLVESSIWNLAHVKFPVHSFLFIPF
jgi:valyl-tRNA synthetase